MKLPAIWRKRRKDKKEYGNCYATVAGDDINLGSEDRNEARETLRAILIQKAAEASEPDVEDGATDTPGEAANQSQGPDPAPAVAPSPAPAPAPVVPDQVMRDSEAEARAEAEATNAAAAETGASSPANDNAAPTLKLSPDALRGLLAQAAQVIVISQIDLQAWLIKKRTGKIVPRVIDQGIVDLASKAWVAQLEVWFPDLEKCPPWLLAVGAPLLLMPAQLQHAQDPPKETPSTAQGPMNPAVQVAA